MSRRQRNAYGSGTVDHLPLHPSLAVTIEAIRELIERGLAGEDPAVALRFAKHGLAALCEALEDQHERWWRDARQRSEFFASAPDACLLTDPGGLILHANRASAELFRVPPAFLVERSLASFIAAHELPAFRKRLRALSGDDQPSRWRADIARGNGARLAVELSVRRAPGERLCWLVRRASPPADIDR